MLMRLSASLSRSASQRLRQDGAAVRELLDMAVEQAVDAGDVGFQRLDRASRPLIEPLQLLGDHAFDGQPAFLQLRDVGLERLRDRIAAVGEFLHLAATRLSIAGRSALSARDRMSRPSASFSTWAATMPSMPDAALGQLAEVGLQSARQDVAALGQLADVAGDHFVNVHAGLDEFLRVFGERARQALAACRQPFELVVRARRRSSARCSLILRRSSSSARDSMLRPSASFWTWAADGGVDRGAAFGEFRQVGLQRRGHAVAALGQLAGVVLDGLLDAGAGFAKPLDVGVEGARDDVAGVLEPAGEVAGARFEHRRGRLDDVGHLGADPRLALVDHVEERLLALGEGRGDFAWRARPASR